MEEFIIYAVVGIFAFWLGWHIRGIIVLANVGTNPDKMIKILEEIKRINQSEKSPDTVEIRAETVNGVVYAYNNATGDFLAQGANLMQAVTLAAVRHPGTKFWHPELQEDSHTAC